MSKLNTFKIYYSDDTDRITSASGTLEEFTEYIMQDGGRDVEEVYGVEIVRQIEQVGQVVWHVFADNLDEFHETQAEGEKAYDRLIEEHASVRLYFEVVDQDGDTIEEDHIKGQGDFPW